MRGKLELEIENNTFVRDEGKMERVFENVIEPRLRSGDFSTSKVIQEIWNDESLTATEVVDAIMKVGVINQRFEQYKSNPLLQLSGGLH